MKTLLAATLLSISFPALAQAGRYQMVVPNGSPDRYLLDTQTGQTWVITGTRCTDDKGKAVSGCSFNAYMAVPFQKNTPDGGYGYSLEVPPKGESYFGGVSR